MKVGPRSLSLVLGLLGCCLVAAQASSPADGPFRFHVEREDGRVQARACLVAGGVEKELERLDGRIPAAGRVLEAPAEKPRAAVVLWLDAETGKEGRLRLYALPAGRKVWESRGFMHADLAGGPDDRSFAIAVPLRELGLSGPHLRALHFHSWDGQTVRETGRAKEPPSTPAQQLEWAADELATGHTADALGALEAWDRQYGSSLDLRSEHAMALDLMARGQVRLGRGPALLATLGRLVREHPGEPAADAAQEALRFIAQHSLDAYLRRESVER